MARRYVILTSAVVLAIAIAVPAIGDGANPFGVASKASQKSKRALKQAKRAKKKARQANKKAKKAKKKAREANQNAKQAIDLADQLTQELDTTRIVSDTEAGTVTSTAPIGGYEARGGPSVQVTVPGSGLIEVWAQADINDENGGAVGLYEDGQKVPGISEEEFCGDASAVIEMDGGGPGDFETFSTPPTTNLSLGCTNTGAPAPVILQRPPGNHTYELRYSLCQCPPPAAVSEFRNRVLRVGPRL